jgi:RimJ/RimL family protein N-acetyltransferase
MRGYRILKKSGRFNLIGDIKGKLTNTLIFAAEVLLESARWLQNKHYISEIVLGVSLDNPSAIRAYEKVGFVHKSTDFIPLVSSDSITMVWNLDEI